MNRRQRRAAERKERRRPSVPSSNASDLTSTPDRRIEAARAAVTRKDFSQAIALAEDILDESASDSDALLVRAMARQQVGNTQGAEADYRRVLELDARQPIAAANLGAICLGRSEIRAAANFLDIALSVEPKLFAALVNRGIVHQVLGEIDAAIRCFTAATRIQPNAPEPYWRLSDAYRFVNDLENAIEMGRKAISLAPDDVNALASLVYARMRSCDWDGLSAQLDRLKAAAEARLDAGLACPLRPFVAMVTYDDPAFNLRIARLESRKLAARAAPLRRALGAVGKSCDDGPIRLGYLSAGFGDRPTSHLTRRLYRLHDRSRFSVLAFALGPDDESPYRRDIAADCDEFIDLEALDPMAAARRIRERRIDILVDMRGYLQNNRIGIVAARPAPVQVNYLAYPCTTGADFLDYIVCDRIVVPPGHERYYAEAPIFMPDCYQINDPVQDVSSNVPSRAECGLPEGAIVFSSFNINYKIDPVMFAAWMRILDAVPNSVLWLLKSSDLSAQNLMAAARRHGVAPGRLVFAEMRPKPDHMARLPIADLGLDTRICNGHTTTTDMLCAGVPVLTLQGRHFASRVASSLLINHGLSDLVTTTLEEYVGLAVDLANDRAALAAVRDRVRVNKATWPLFNVENYVHNLESAYEAIWRRYLSGEPPQAITIAHSGSATPISKR